MSRATRKSSSARVSVYRVTTGKSGAGSKRRKGLTPKQRRRTVHKSSRTSGGRLRF